MALEDKDKNFGDRPSAEATLSAPAPDLEGVRMDAERIINGRINEQMYREVHRISPESVNDFGEILAKDIEPRKLNDMVFGGESDLNDRWYFFNALLHNGKVGDLFKKPYLEDITNSTPYMLMLAIAQLAEKKGRTTYTREKFEGYVGKVANIYGGEAEDYMHDFAKFYSEAVASGGAFVWPDFLPKENLNDGYKNGSKMPQFLNSEHDINDRLSQLLKSSHYVACSGRIIQDYTSDILKGADVSGKWEKNRADFEGIESSFVIEEFEIVVYNIPSGKRDAFIRDFFESYASDDPCGLEFFRFNFLFESDDPELREDFVKRYHRILKGDSEGVLKNHLLNIVKSGPIHSASLAIKVLAEFYQSGGDVWGNIKEFVDALIDAEPETQHSKEAALKLFYFVSYFGKDKMQEIISHICRAVLTNECVWWGLMEDGILDQEGDSDLAFWLNDLQKNFILFGMLDSEILFKVAGKVLANDENAKKKFSNVLNEIEVPQGFDSKKALEEMRSGGFWKSKNSFALGSKEGDDGAFTEFSIESLKKDDRASSWKLRIHFEGLVNRRYINGDFFADFIDGKMGSTNITTSKPEKAHFEQVAICIAYDFFVRNRGEFVDERVVEEIPEPEAIEPELEADEPATLSEPEPITEPEPAAEQPELTPEPEFIPAAAPVEEPESALPPDSEVEVEPQSQPDFDPVPAPGPDSTAEESLLNVNDFADPEDEFDEKSEEAQTFINRNNESVSRLISEGTNFKGDFSSVFLFWRREMESNKEGQAQRYWYERCKPEQLKEIVARGDLLSQDLYVPIIAPHLGACGYYPSTKTIRFITPDGRHAVKTLRTLTKKAPSDDAILAYLYHSESGMPSVGEMEPREAYLRVGVNDYEELETMAISRRKGIVATNKKFPLMRRGIAEKIIKTLQDGEWRNSFILSKIGEIDRDMKRAEAELSGLVADITSELEKEEQSRDQVKIDSLTKRGYLLMDEISRMQGEKEKIPGFWNDIARKSESSVEGDETGVPFWDRVRVHAAVTRATSEFTFNGGVYMPIGEFAVKARG